MKEADLYNVTDHETKTVQCLLCNHRCLIKKGNRGICQVRENHDGKLFSLVYGRIISEHIDPIEKKPIFHMLPGSSSYSIATVGCNFRCIHCQNSEISQYPARNPGSIPGRERTPGQIIEAALLQKCQSISYTYVEPTIFFEFAYDTARLAHESGLKNVFVSNGYTSPEATKKIAPFLTANNIDLKAFTEKFYHEVCGAKLAPVLETITLMKKLGIWVEVTTLVIPDWNDSDRELSEIANFIKNVDPEIPWHVSRFYPTYKMTDRTPTPVSTLQRAREIGIAAGLKYVYTGNIPDDTGENTYCPDCGTIVIKRSGYTTTHDLKNGTCRKCRANIPGIF
ncbi:MAG: AmmeMemoRadiSam system radical SAM enzyme [Proteobacteria bacterium]|nr:AmmeMemoRadiSam system radical SAM enzyme [Pseudomonadota bacterium]MBU1715862.1 AmmeMemoRadiSam system radical SAM enzyme [Pseudomonadota bacterium]